MQSAPQITPLSTKFMHERGGVPQLDIYPKFMHERGDVPQLDIYPIFALILPTEHEDHDQTIHRVPVNALPVILRFHGQN